jgi:hypothetical protein
MFGRLSVPELVRFNRSSYSSLDDVTEEAQIGPEIMHIYQVISLPLPLLFMSTVHYFYLTSLFL